MEAHLNPDRENHASACSARFWKRSVSEKLTEKQNGPRRAGGPFSCVVISERVEAPATLMAAFVRPCSD
jgi:hypothetical protein